MVFKLETLNNIQIREIINRALTDKEKGLGMFDADVDEDAIDHLVNISNGDARIALNGLEIGVLTTPPNNEGRIKITLEVAQESVQQRAIKYEKNGDEHYDTISAFIKSMRGSDPDAVLYWLAKMIYAGEDPKFIARRIIICASEDIGNADPQALSVAISAFEAVNFIGMPEGRIPLAQAAVYMACAPKSNSSYVGIKKALQDIEKIQTGQVPTHLKDASYNGAAKFGHGKGYLYPHEYPNNYIPQQYLPDELTGVRYYNPSDNGYERDIKERMEKLRNMHSNS